MRLGKALATGVAEESTGSSGEELEDRLAADRLETEQLVEESADLEPQAEVPAVR